MSIFHKGIHVFLICLWLPTLAMANFPTPTPTPTPQATPVVYLSSATKSISEHIGEIEINICVSNPSPTGSVYYATSNGTATAGGDYTNKSATINLGESDKIITIHIADDSNLESNETFYFTLSNPQFATLGSPYQQTITIIDNDYDINVNTPSSPQCGNTTINYTLKNANSDATNIQVKYNTDGSSIFSETCIEASGMGSQGMQNLSSSPSGVQHTFVWNSPANLIYSNQVKVRITAGSNNGTSNVFTVDNQPPSFSGLSKAEPDWNAYPENNTGTINLSWNSASDDTTPIKYDIYRSIGQDINIDYNSPLFSGQTPTNAIVSSLSTKENYAFAIRAKDNTLCQNKESNTVVKKVWGWKADDYIDDGDSAMVLGYNFSEGSGNICANVSTSDLTGSVSGATWTTSGRFGNALQFDGINDYVETEDRSPCLDLSTFTLECWLKLNSTNGTQVILEKMVGMSGFRFSIDNAKLKITIGNDENLFYLSGGTSLQAGIWYHVAAVHDNFQNLMLYLNGIDDSAGSTSGNIMDTGKQSLYIGCTSSGENYLNGVLDSVAIYYDAKNVTWFKSHILSAPRGNLIINDGDGFTNDSEVLITLSTDFSTQTAQMMIGGDVVEDANTFAWIPFSAQKAITLSKDETATIKARFRDSNDNETWATADTIYYDDLSSCSLDTEDTYGPKARINYTLYDVAGDPLNVAFQYSMDDGATYYTMTEKNRFPFAREN